MGAARRESGGAEGCGAARMKKPLKKSPKRWESFGDEAPIAEVIQRHVPGICERDAWTGANLLLGARLVGPELLGRTYADDVELIKEFCSLLRAAVSLSNSTSFPVSSALKKGLQNEMGPDIVSVLNRLPDAADNAAKHALEVASEIPKAGKADWVAASVAHQCRRIWKEATNEEAPESIFRDVGTDGEGARGDFAKFVWSIFRVMDLSTKPQNALDRLRVEYRRNPELRSWPALG